MQWDDASRTLTIGARQGQFPGVLVARTFKVVPVSPEHGIGEGQSTGKTVVYSGAALRFRIPPETPAGTKKHPACCACNALSGGLPRRHHRAFFPRSAQSKSARF
jgi:hypothetical protein